MWSSAVADLLIEAFCSVYKLKLSWLLAQMHSLLLCMGDTDYMGQVGLHGSRFETKRAGAEPGAPAGIGSTSSSSVVRREEETH